MIIKALQDNLLKRALHAAKVRDIKTLRNLRSFAEERGDLPTPLTSTLSAMIGNALLLRESGSTIRTAYQEEDARLWYREVNALRNTAPLYAQVSLAALAAEEHNCTAPYNPTCLNLYRSCY